MEYGSHFRPGASADKTDRGRRAAAEGKAKAKARLRKRVPKRSGRHERRRGRQRGMRGGARRITIRAARAAGGGWSCTGQSASGRRSTAEVVNRHLPAPLRQPSPAPRRRGPPHRSRVAMSRETAPLAVSHSTPARPLRRCTRRPLAAETLPCPERTSIVWPPSSASSIWSRTTSSSRSRCTPCAACSLTVEEGDFVALMGPSGSGKSTLLNLLGCLDRPTSGQYYLGDEDVSQMDDDQLSEIRSRYLGFIFQSYNLLPQYTVVENIEVPLLYQGCRLNEETRQRCIALAEHGRPGRPPRSSADAAFRRPAAARGHRPRPGQRSARHPGRRADRQPRFAAPATRSWRCLQQAQRRRQDHHHGHARKRHRRLGQARGPHARRPHRIGRAQSATATRRGKCRDAIATGIRPLAES